MVNRQFLCCDFHLTVKHSTVWHDAYDETSMMIREVAQIRQYQLLLFSHTSIHNMKEFTQDITYQHLSVFYVLELFD